MPTIPSDVDIALVLDTIRPSAQWRGAVNYQRLVDTWEDEVQTIPTEQEIIDAWPATQQKWDDIRDKPSPDEILAVLLEEATSPAAIALKVRNDKAAAARGR